MAHSSSSCMVRMMGLVLFVLALFAPGAAQGFSRRKLSGQINGGGGAEVLANGVCKALVNVHGYKCQEIFVTTADGYILSVQRIPASRNGIAGKEPVIIQHGVLVDAATWLLNAPDRNLPLILADHGYDVWLANTRGTRFSRRHTSLDPADPKFWNWSFDELVAHDLPAVLNYVHAQTKQKANYIGHSLGTLIALASLSEGKLVDQLKSVALLSPVAYLSYMTTPIGAVGARLFAGEITKLFGYPEFIPKSEAVAKLIDQICAAAGIPCYDLLTIITGKNCCLNASTVDLFLQNEPQPTSTKTFVHLSQVVRTNVLAKYDYGRLDINFMHYRSFVPPRYDLSKIPTNMPVFISYGGRDALSDQLDVLRLLDHLKYHDKKKLVVDFIREYAHADFVMGINANELVYSKVISFFKQLE